jgi:hypothetical protein
MPKHRILLAAAFFLCAASNAFAAGEIVLTMDDLPTQPVNGLMHPTGVQFGFTVVGAASLDATYHGGGPGIITFVQDPSIEGTVNGVLSVTFPNPTPSVRFGLARNATTQLTNGATVELFDASNVSLGTINLALNPMPMFAEGQFTYSGSAVKRMTVGFPEGFGSNGRFAFDNLLFQPIPEPVSAVMWVGGIIFAAWSSRLHRPRLRCDWRV